MLLLPLTVTFFAHLGRREDLFLNREKARGEKVGKEEKRKSKKGKVQPEWSGKESGGGPKNTF